MRYLVFILVACALLIASCTDGRDTQERQGRQLYLEEKRLIQTYIDSIRQMPDSADVTALMRRYQEKLWSINSTYPADTDLELNQGENDTIYALTQELLKYAEKRGVKTDTIIADSVDSIPKL